jgi:hypothetical protein
MEKEANRYRTNQARALFQAGKLDESREILKAINPEDYSENDYVALNRRLDSAKPLIPSISDLAAMTREVRPVPRSPSAAGTKTKPAKSSGAEDEPDPFSTMPAKPSGAKTKPEAKPADPNDEPDPFAAPAKKTAPKKKAPAADKDDEPDPFAR